MTPPKRSSTNSSQTGSGRTHHLDRRASVIVEQSQGGADDLLTTREVADWLGVSHQFLEIGRLKSYGPKFVRVSSRLIRYKRGDVLAWLKSRTHCSTGEYLKTEAA
jgi:predicted DNA-binding transcriptional regulator AlpA